MTFQEAAIESAHLYYDYLEKNGGGLVTYRVLRILPSENAFKKNEYWLYLEQRPRNLDGLQIRIENYEYSDEQIKPLTFDAYRRRLKVSLNEKTLGVFDHCNPESVSVFSDLKFLVRRVEAWYKQFGGAVMLPKGQQLVSLADCSALKSIPSADQMTAIAGVLSHPFSYVWGAPGTGKTQFVLARTVLSYIQEGKKVLVTAPTNNAVEQTLHGLLPVLEEAGLDYNKLVIRLGTASTNFVEKYPGVCEDTEYSKVIAEIQDHLSSLMMVLSENVQSKRLYKEYIRYKERFETFEKAKVSIEHYTSQLLEKKQVITSLRDSIGQVSADISDSKKKLEEVRNNYGFFNNQAQDLLKRLQNPIYIALSWFNKEEQKQKIDEALEKARYYEEKESPLKAELASLIDKKEQLQHDLSEKILEFENLLYEFSADLAFSPELKQSVSVVKETSAEVDLHKLKCIYDDTMQELLSERAKYTSVLDKTDLFFEEERHQISQQIQFYEHRKNDLEQNDVNKRTKESLVIACTIDVCLNRLPISEENHFAHVFSDEAGYSSLIKAATLTAYSDRLTFLGDHMQLPPVCEADDRIIATEDYHLLALWAQSSLALENIFSESPELLCQDYLNKARVPFRTMVKYDLVNSYRFGERLARVLADDVYDRSFHGNDGKNTKIFYINAPKRPEKQNRVSSSECDAIEAFLKQYNGKYGSTGIIAPYKNQVALLKQIAKRNQFPLDCIITVHQSQGREWNNILLSVTDTTDKFFTNSLNPASDGKKVINTAVSRAKKNLIIVCDYDYWIKQRGQLIGKLLAVAEELPIPR